MSKPSGSFARELKRQRNKALLWNFVLPLIIMAVVMVVIILVVNISFFSYERDRSLTTARALAAGEVRSAEEVRRDFPSSFVLYFDENYELIDEFGNPSDFSAPDKLSNPNDLSTVSIGGSRYMTATLETSHVSVNATADDVRYVRVYYNIDAETALRDRITAICLIFMGAVFVVQSLIGYFAGRAQTKPFARALERNNRLIADISHELNTPLAIVNSDLSATLERPEDKVNDVSEKLVSALKETQRLKRMIKELLVLSASDADRLSLDFESADVSAILREIGEPFSMMAQLDGKEFSLDIEDGIVAVIDADKLRQISIALLDNAMKYTACGESVTLSLHRHAGKLVLGVADTGRGVPPEQMKNIFERFYRTDDSRNSKTGGTGLGLAIVKEIVSHMGARIYARANEPKGFAVEVVFDLRTMQTLAKKGG